MNGVGPGTVLGGRYAVHRRLAQDRGTERWSADDTTLGRRVSVLVIPLEDHRCAAFLDAARRAASVSHTVLARVLDVGQDQGVAYVVEEELADARSLAELVTSGGIPGDEVRRITGEVAAALESARQRGMHHLDLTPDDVLRTADGEVRVRGLEVAGVRAGEDGLDPDDAARRDAVGVVALAYAGLTGLWPLGTGASGLAAAPQVPGGVASPSEVTAGVPRDLDAICRLTLNDDQGPTSPGDYARQVAPWPSRQVLGRPLALDVERVEPTGPVVAETVAASSSPVAHVEPTATLPVLGNAPVAERPAPVAEPSASVVEPPTEVGGAGAPMPHQGRVLEPAGGTGAPGGSGPVSAGAAAAAGAAGAAVADALGTVGSRVSELARRAVDKVSELSPDTERGPGDAADFDDEAPAPLVPAEPLTRDDSKLALGIVAAFLVLALVIGIYGMTKIGSRTDLGLDGPGTGSRTASGSPSATGSPEDTGSGEGGAPEPLAILKVEAYDPEGDGAENNNLTPKTYDGDTSTGWNSENYRTDAFGGLKKGVGLIVDLGPNKKPQSVQLDVPQNVTLEVYIGPDASLEGATKIGAESDKSGRLTFEVPQEVGGQYIVLWYTALHADQEGKRRAWLNEVVVNG